MATVRDLIKSALRQIGAIDPGENVEASEAADALATLNQMLEQWSTENLLVPLTVRERFDLVGGQSSYTMGTGGNFNTTRPVKIEIAKLETQDGTPYELDMELLTEREWANISDKAQQSTLPTKLYAMGSSPLETLKLWPVPTVANKIVLYSVKTITVFTTINDSVELPQGYYSALKFNLAVELAPEYGKSPSEVTVTKAMSTLKNLKRINKKALLMVSDSPGVGSHFNIISGD